MMVATIASIFVTALVVTGVGIALRPGSSTAAVLKAGLAGFTDLEKGTYGPQ